MASEPASDPRTFLGRITLRGAATAAEVQALIELLGDARKHVQRGAAETLAMLHERGSDVRGPVSAALRSRDRRQRWGAAFALSRLGTLPGEAVPVLLQALADEDGDIRWAASEILGRARHVTDLPERLCDTLRRGNAPARKMAAYCLRDLGGRSADIEATLLGALDDEDVSVRLAAIAGAARLAVDRLRVAERLTDLLEGCEVRVRRAAAVALGDVAGRSQRVLEALREAARSCDVGLRRAAERSLRRLDPP